MTQAAIFDRIADAERVGYYVSVIDGNRKGLLLGPYDDHSDALANVNRARNLAYDADPRSHWYAFGTCKITTRNKLPNSVFNR